MVLTSAPPGRVLAGRAPQPRSSPASGPPRSGFRLRGRRARSHGAGALEDGRFLRPQPHIARPEQRADRAPARAHRFPAVLSTARARRRAASRLGAPQRGKPPHEARAPAGAARAALALLAPGSETSPETHRFASSAESVVELRLCSGAEVVNQGGFRRYKRPESVRPSRCQFPVVVQALSENGRDGDRFCMVWCRHPWAFPRRSSGALWLLCCRTRPAKPPHKAASRAQ